jgi:chemotaxis protein methyltransferase CheR
VITDRVERFRHHVITRLGLRVEDDQLGELSALLDRRAAAITRGDAEAYLARLDAELVLEERRALARDLTVGETYFFRHVEQFRALTALVAARPPGAPLRILSAGCASGDEAYTIAIMLREAGVPIGPLELIGIDVNPAALERARAALFSSWALRDTDAPTRARHFVRRRTELALDPSLVRQVRFEERNLLDEDDRFWQPERFDVIFCRNVLMYFPAETARAVVSRMERSLAPGGHLFLGHAETLRGLSVGFHLCHTHETFYYQRRMGAESGGPTLSWHAEIDRATRRVASLTDATPAPPATPASPSNLDLDEVIAILDRARVDEAEVACRRLLASDELDAGAHYLMALVCEQAGDLAAAVEHDRTAAYLDDGFALPRLHLGLMARRAGDAESARRELGRALELVDGESNARLARFGGGFSREALSALCSSELRACGAAR